MTFYALLLAASLLPALVLAVRQPEFFMELWLDLRLGRIFHYFVLYLFGCVLYAKTPELLLHLPPVFLLKSALYFVILAYAAVFAIATNNQEDLEIDRITNTNRPLVRNAVDPELYRRIAIRSLVISCILAALAGLVFLLAIGAISLVYYLYSCKPFKLKRFVLLAKFLIGVNSLISAVCGFYVAGGYLSDFPVFWLIFLLIPVALMANFVDLKDTEGDKVAGIKTLPVLLGEKDARYLIVLFTIVAYGFVYVYFDTLWISILLAIICSAHVFLLFRKPYSEKPLFLLHNSLFIGLIVLVLTSQYLQR